MLVQSYDYATDTTKRFVPVVPSGPQMWKIEIFTEGAENNLDTELVVKSPIDFDGLLDMFDRLIDEQLDEMPAGVNVGWRVHYVPKRNKKHKKRK